MKRIGVVLLVALFSLEAQAGPRLQWLQERFSVDLTLVGGWRAALISNVRGGGFEVLGGGGELVVGLDITPLPWIGVFASGRLLGYGIRQYEGDAGIGVLLHPRGRVHVRVGACAGEIRIVDERFGVDERAVPVGGFVGTTIELFHLGNRLSTAMSARFDVVDLLRASTNLPDASLSLAVGLGVHY